MKKLTIDRKRWLRGEGSEVSALLRKNDGKMCCIGFYALQVGYTPTDIEDIQTPPSLSQQGAELKPDMLRLVTEQLNYQLKKPYHTRYLANEVCADLMEINDRVDNGLDGAFPEEEREERIRKLFAKIDVEVEFIN